MAAHGTRRLVAVSAPPRPAEPILHVDMDAFYASVEIREAPELKGRPVLVGGAGGRGVVASASYEARRFGIHSAMPMAHARRLCADAVVVAPNFARYQAVSEQLGAIFRAVTPLVEPLSLDEAFLDVGGSVRLFGAPPEIGEMLRGRIRDELALEASVGVAANKFLAKLCSQKAKPEGLLHLPATEAERFVAGLPVGDLWGVGPQTAARLERFGLRVVADLTAIGEPTLQRIVGPAAGAHLRALARGRDPRPVIPHEPAKGMSAEETFERDIDDLAILRVELLRLAERIGQRLRHGQVAARTVTLKLRHADFTTVTRSRTLALPTDQATELHHEVVGLLDALRLERVRVRLIGLGTSNLVPSDVARQLRLLGEERWSQLDLAADRARARFGEHALTRGVLLDDRLPQAAARPTPTREQLSQSGHTDGPTGERSEN